MRLLITIIYKPIGIICGIIAGLAAKRLFEFLWARVDEQDPPDATTQDTTTAKVLGAAAIEGIVFKTTRAAVDRWGAQTFHYLTGVWPGDREADRA